jgi:TolC family type I secretion outer membrane protein
MLLIKIKIIKNRFRAYPTHQAVQTTGSTAEGGKMRMPSLVVCLTLMCCITTSWGQSQNIPQDKYPSALSLHQAVQIAVSENPVLAAARSQVEIAEQRVIQGRSGFLPRLNASEGLQRTNNPTQVFSNKLNQENFTTSDFAINRLNQPNAINDFATNFTATWPIYDGGRSWHGWQQAKIGKDASTYALEKNRQQVIARTTAAYAGVLLALENLAVVEGALRTAGANLFVASNRYSTGMAVKSDLLQAQARQSDLEQQKIMAESQIEVARSMLNAAMGVPDPLRFELMDRLETPAALEGTLESWLSISQDRRLDLKELNAREAMAKEEVEKAKAAFLPSLDLIGNYQIHTEDFDGSADNYSVGAVVSLNIFSGLETSAKVSEAQAALRQTQALRRQMQSQVALEVRQAYAQTVSAFQRVGVARQTVVQAEESLRIVTNRYVSGLFTMVDLLTGEATLQQARTTYTQALHDYLVWKTNLRLAAGVLDQEI